MARIEEVERRLQNWARWKMGGGSGGLGFAGVQLTSDTSRAGYREAVIPTMDCEAEETDRAIGTLPSELRRTLEVVYLDGDGMASKAKKLACTRITVDSRVWRAHQLINAWLQDLAAQRRAQQANLEAMQKAVRS